MNVAVRYQSQGGNTKGMAEMIAQTVGVIAEPVTTPLQGPIDVLFLGGAVYMWGIDITLKNFLRTLDPGQIGQIVPFSTTGLMPFAIWKIKRGAKDAGIPVSKQSLCLKIMMQGHAMLGREGGSFNENQIKKITRFADAAIHCA